MDHKKAAYSDGLFFYLHIGRFTCLGLASCMRLVPMRRV